MSKSISHEYGVGFDGAAYLDRFVDRTFHLPIPPTKRLVSSLYSSVFEGVKKELWFPAIGMDGSHGNVSKEEFIAELLAYYRLPPRSVFKYFDRLRTSVALAGMAVLPMNYLCELAAQEMTDLRPKEQPKWRFFLPGGFGAKGEWLEGNMLFNEMFNTYSLPRKEMEKRLQNDNHVTEILWSFVGNSDQPGAEEFHRILKRVSDFQ